MYCDSDKESNHMPGEERVLLHVTVWYDLCLLMNLLLAKSVQIREHFEICIRLGYYTAWNSNPLPTFQDNILGPSSRAKKSNKNRKPAGDRKLAGNTWLCRERCRQGLLSVWETANRNGTAWEGEGTKCKAGCLKGKRLLGVESLKGAGR
jgi:hypothetical protein